MAFGIGLYSSRKYAVPIYKLEQWVTLLQQGKMGAMLRFREKEEMKDLSDKCNMLAADLRFKFMEIRKEIDKLKQTDPSSSIASKMEKTLAGLELEIDSIEVSQPFTQWKKTESEVSVNLLNIRRNGQKMSSREIQFHKIDKSR